MIKIDYEIAQCAIEKNVDISKFNIDKPTMEKIIDEIIVSFNQSKSSFKYSQTIQTIFLKYNINLSKNICRKIKFLLQVYRDFKETFYEFNQNDLLKDKIELNLKDFEFTLKIHDNFIVKTNPKGTYINEKYFYSIEEQDLLESYCDFITSPEIYVQFKRKRIFPIIPHPYKFFKIYSKTKNLEKLKRNKNVDIIFNNKELLYKSN